MRSVLDHLVGVLDQGQSAVLAGVMHSSGSAPRASGARMLVFQDGSLVGSVGGGVLEGACLARAGQMLQGDETFALLNMTLDNVSAANDGMVCGGRVEILLVRVTPDEVGLFHRLQQGCRDGGRPLLLTMLPDGGEPPVMLVMDGQENDGVPAKLRHEVLRRSGRMPFFCTHQGRDVFVEPLAFPGTVHFVGAGHVALAAAHLARFAGFATVIMDDRADFASEKRFPQASTVKVLEDFNRCFGELGADDYVVIVTRGHLYDRDVLAQALRTDAGYIGMIGSRRKRDTIYTSLLDEGFLPTDLERVHCPIGMAIEAETPEEIGVSIIAELIQVRNGSR